MAVVDLCSSSLNLYVDSDDVKKLLGKSFGPMICISWDHLHCRILYWLVGYDVYFFFISFSQLQPKRLVALLTGEAMECTREILGKVENNRQIVIL